MLEKKSLWRHLLPYRGGTRVGRGTFLWGPLWETDGHHKVIQHRALWQLHQSHIILKCVGVILGMKEDVFDPEMLFSLIWPLSPMFTWARRRYMSHGGNEGTEDKVTLYSLSALCLIQSMFPALTLLFTFPQKSCPTCFSRYILMGSHFCLSSWADLIVYNTNFKAHHHMFRSYKHTSRSCAASSMKSLNEFDFFS